MIHQIQQEKMTFYDILDEQRKQMKISFEMD